MYHKPTEGAITRMLLRSDGSTTLLLESLLDTSLSVEVEGQFLASHKQIDPDIITYLQAESTDQLYIRRSSLKMNNEIKVSYNFLVMRVPQGREELYETLCTSTIPLGKQITNHRIEHHRHLIGDGRVKMEFDGCQRQCYFKHYLLELYQKPTFYIHETFHPDFVPVAAN